MNNTILYYDTIKAFYYRKNFLFAHRSGSSFWLRQLAALPVAKFGLVLLLLVGLWAPQPVMAATGNIDTSNKYAWSENTGWNNYRPSDGGVTVYGTYLTGYAWAENIGYIKLGNDNGGPYNNTSSSDWGVNHDNSTGNLSGLLGQRTWAG